MNLNSHVNGVLNALHHDAISRDVSYNQLFDSYWENLMFFDSMLSSVLKIRIFQPG